MVKKRCPARSRSPSAHRHPAVLNQHVRQHNNVVDRTKAAYRNLIDHVCYKPQHQRVCRGRTLKQPRASKPPPTHILQADYTHTLAITLL